MNEAPKKIWVDAYAAKYDLNESSANKDIAYIRADLVDGLVEAVKEIFLSASMIEFGASCGKARAALKALEEE